jgi:hypothetical protein
MSNEICFDLENESDNALAIKIKNDILDKLLRCSTESEVKQAINEIITDNYESLDISKVRTGEAPIATVLGPVLDSFVVCSLEETTSNLNNTQIQVGEILKNAIDLVCNPPTFTIPSPFPIIDPSQDFLKQLQLALLKLVVKILLSLLKNLLQLTIQICSSGLTPQNSYGSANFGDLLAASFGNAIDESTTYINDVFAAFGLDPNGVPATVIVTTGEACADEQEPVVAKPTSDFLNDLSSVLTPTEVCSLFDGSPSDETYQIVEELLSFDYPNIKSLFNTRVKIKELFILLGKKIDPKLCETIRNNAETISSRPELCFTDDGTELRKVFLKERDLSDEEIESLLDKEREKQKTNLEKVANIIATIKSDPNKLFGEEPNIFCKNGNAGIISMDQMPSLSNNISSATDYTFNLFATTNKNEASYYASSLLTQDKVLNSDEPVIAKFTTLSIQDKNGNAQTIINTLNPTFVQRTSFGSFDLCDPFGNTDIDSLKAYYSGGSIDTIDDDGNLNIQAIISVTSKKEARKLGVGDNVFIANYKTEEKLAVDLFDLNYGIINSGSNTSATYPNSKFLGDLITTDVSNMSISINVPTKFVLFGQQTTLPDFTTVESVDNIVIYTNGI